jgi:dTDP-4-dehydrorhamnose reductase
VSRILLIGSDGQLGRELKDILALSPTTELFSVNRQQLDLTETEKIEELVEQVRPKIIINAAAYTAVDKAETEVDLANLINGSVPGVMALAAQKHDAILIHVSTDYVFDGTNHTPYTEIDAPNPIGIYGSSKLAGEKGIQAGTDKYIILRTAWVYGEFGQSNFVKTMVRLFKEREEVKVVVDQIGTPSWAKDIAETIIHFSDRLTENIDNKAALQSLMGIYHYTNSGAASWYDLAVAIFEEAQVLGLPMKIQRICPITTPEYPTIAQRPAYSVLSKQKISTLFSEYPPHWQESLRKMLKKIVSG